MRSLVILGALALAGCNARRGETVDRPVQPATQQAQSGEKVFFRHCHQCHPNGEAGLGPALNNKPLPAAAVKAQVRTGVGAMPSFGPGAISDTELDDLAAYVEALRKS